MILLLAPSNAADYRQLRLTALSSDPKAFLSSFESEEKIPLENIAHKLFRNSTPPIYGYYGYLNEKQELVGCIHLANEWIFKRRHIVTFNELYVLSDFRRRGIAAELIGHCLNLLKTISGKEQVELHVNSDNLQAIKLYKKLGFFQVATIPKAVKEPDGYQDEHVFIYNI
jgi:ribosomal protein S18 acetylase RimI-like enzyme